MSKSLFIGNIPYGAMEKEIEELFGEVGTVEDVRFAMDFRKGRFRGYGFVRMDEAGADLALDKLDGVEFQGRSLRVSPAQSNAAARRSA